MRSLTTLLGRSLALLALTSACGGDPAPREDGVPSVDVPDAGAADGEGADAPATEVDRVPLAADALPAAQPGGRVRAARATREELISGEYAQGLPGDLLLENDHGRYLIGDGARAVGPCAWDGNPAETELKRPGGGTGSVLGDVCLLLNVAQTIAPEHAELLEDGSGGRAVVAVTGRVVPLDFLNFSAVIEGFAPGLSDLLDFDPEAPLPLRVTFYYVLTPDSRSLRVLTALRNDGSEDAFFLAAHLVLSGSTGTYFTPLGGQRGWGYASLGSSSISADPVSFLGYFARHAGYAVVPDPDPAMIHPLPVGAGMLAISGAAALVHGTTDILPAILAPRSDWPTTPGMQQVAPGGVLTLGYRLYPADGSVSSAADPIYEDLGVTSTRVTGRVVDHAGAPREGVRVTALHRGERAFNMAWTAADGTFAMRLPRALGEGSWTFRMRDDEVPTTLDGVTLEGPDKALGDVSLVEPATLALTVRTPEGAPTPARAVIACAEACPELLHGSNERDGSFSPPNGWYRVVELGVSGEAEIALPAGAFRVAVSRGMTWSTWPSDATDNGGALITTAAGERYTMAAEIAQVVDTSGALGADFHVHAMASPDSQVADRLRVLDLMAGGLDVIVSTDHEAIVDFAPTIAALGAQSEVASIVGSEITTSGLGHINAFPLTADPTARRGGSLDWTRGGGYHLTLSEVVDAVQEHPGEQIVQLNHPASPMGAIGLLGVDVLTGLSFVAPETLRMAPTEADPVTGDTRLWSEGFDAIELYNGFGMEDFWAYFRWWLAMVGRGFAPAGTAVTDTHGLYGSLGASPRSFVFVDDAADTPATLDVGHFVARIRDGALIGTNGPFMRVEVESGDGERAGLGGTLDVRGGQALLKVAIEVPTWIDVDTVDVYLNTPGEGLTGAPGEALRAALEPQLSVPVSWGPEHREVVATGASPHVRLRQVVEIPLAVTVDSFVVVRVHATQARSMQLVVGGSPLPMAFSNPIFLDADGGGYDKPPLAALRAARLAEAGGASARQAALSKARASQVVIPRGVRPAPRDLGRLIEAMSCRHGPGAAPHHHAHGVRAEVSSKSAKGQRANARHDHVHGHEHGHTHGGPTHRH